MPILVESLIRGKNAPTCVRVNTTVREAVRLMYANDFSQLPVLDNRGHVVGLFTDAALTQILSSNDPKIYLNDSVSKWKTRDAEVVGMKREIFDVAKHLAHARAVVVAQDDHKVVGIVTDYDIAVFMAEWSYGFTLVEDIEKKLRGYIVRVFPPAKLTAALFKAFGTDKQDSTKPGRQYDDMSLHDHVQFITYKDNWPEFAPYFGEKQAFTDLMQEVIPIRNQIMHFRGKLTHTQMKDLEKALNWLRNCPHVPMSPSEA